MTARYPSRAPSTVSLRDAVFDLYESLRASLTARLQLAALEGRAAGAALARMVALSILAAILAITAWLVAVWGVAWGLMELGLEPWAALLVVIGANVIGVWLCWRVLRRLAQRLSFPATLRHLHGSTHGVGAAASEPPHEAT